MILVNDKLEIIYDDEDFTGRLQRQMQSMIDQGLLDVSKLPVWTEADIAQMKKAPMMTIDSLGALS